jgi:transposase
VQESLKKVPFAGQLFVFRGKRGDLIKVLWWDGQGFCLRQAAREGPLRVAG